jgi:hypothetical protein
MSANGFFRRKRPACARPAALTALAFALALDLASGIRPASAQAEAQAGATILTIIVTRHGVRAMSPAPDPPAPQYPWPPRQVGPDELTAHGYRLMRRMGEFYREAQSAKGLPVDCAAKTAYVYADVPPPSQSKPSIPDPAQRTLGTAHALIEGLCGSSDSPGSPDALDVFHAADMTSKDPVFDATDRVKIDFDASWDAVAKVAGDPGTIVQRHAAEFKTLQDLLNARCGDVRCPLISEGGDSEILPPKKPAALDGQVERAKLAALHGPLATASAVSEDLFLEFAQCRPEKDMTNGLRDARQLRTDLDAGMRLHVVAYDVNARNDPTAPYNASVRGGTLLASIVAMLDKKAGRPPHSRIRIPDDLLEGKTLVIFSGHDTQLDALSGILDAHWDRGDGIMRDDMPPGSALIFDLVKAPGDDRAYNIRLRFASMARDQFRDEKRFEGPLTSVPYRGCSTGECALTNIEPLVDKLDAEGFVVLKDWNASSKPSPQFRGYASLADPPWTERQCRGGGP